MISRKEAEALEAALAKIQSLENIAGLPQYNLQTPQEFKVDIRVDKKMEHGIFRPDPVNPRGWVCSPQTYRAMKKNIFALDEELLELADDYQCASCREVLDRQFWEFCPFCAEPFESTPF